MSFIPDLDQVHWVILGALVAACVVMYSLAEYLTRYRVDLMPGEKPEEGRHRSFKVLNILDPRNYDEEGRTLLKWLWLVHAVQMALVVLWVVTG